MDTRTVSEADVRVRRTDERVYFRATAPDTIYPTRGTDASAGWDLYALEDTLINPLAHGCTKIRTGIAVQLPVGSMGLVHARSGVSYREGLIITAGVIDEDYTGEIHIVMTMKTRMFAADANHDPSPGVFKISSATETDPALFIDTNGYLIKKGERVAQLTIVSVHNKNAIHLGHDEEFPRSYAAAHQGFGSTGK